MSLAFQALDLLVSSDAILDGELAFHQADPRRSHGICHIINPYDCPDIWAMSWRSWWVCVYNMLSIFTAWCLYQQIDVLSI